MLVVVGNHAAINHEKSTNFVSVKCCDDVTSDTKVSWRYNDSPIYASDGKTPSNHRLIYEKDP